MTGRPKWWRQTERFLVVAVAVALAASCGGDDDAEFDWSEIDWSCETLYDGLEANFQCSPDFSNVADEALEALEPAERPITTTVTEVPGSRPFLADFDLSDFEDLERTVAFGEYAIVPDDDYMRQMYQWGDQAGIDPGRLNRVFKVAPVEAVAVCVPKRVAKFVFICR